MWEEVKPITMLLEQEETDGGRFLMYFYSYDYEIVKLREATYIDKYGNMAETYSRLLEDYTDSSCDASFFIERLSRSSIKKMIEYYENPHLFVEYLV
tara:strand:+ start:370 stop:660 length:291 start_codon:yes stop_codon:yes gene_type:complete